VPSVFGTLCSFETNHDIDSYHTCDIHSSLLLPVLAVAFLERFVPELLPVKVAVGFNMPVATIADLYPFSAMLAVVAIIHRLFLCC
jgi:hypothetical protein